VDALLLAESEVYTGRGQHHYSYAEDGELISATTYSEGDSRKISRVLRRVPTCAARLGFFEPAFSWGTAMIGIAASDLQKAKIQ